MNKTTKPTIIDDIVFEVQFALCDVLYRKLLSLLASTHTETLLLPFNELYQFRLSAELNAKYALSFYSKRTNNSQSYEDMLDFKKKISITEIQDPVILFILEQKLENKPELYSAWAETVKKAIKKLMEEEKKFKNILEDIKNLPFDSPTREVIIEKN